MPFEHVELIEIRAWGKTIGAVSQGNTRNAYDFQFDYLQKDIKNYFPLNMPPRIRPYSFPGLSMDTWHGLPPGIADSLPDKFGNSIIDAELARRGASSSDVSVLDRLAYTGRRAMGALEFHPNNGPALPAPTSLDLNKLVHDARKAVAGTLGTDAESESALAQILAVGTSAGGARAKAVVNLDPVTNELTPGQLPRKGADSWLLKFDGVKDQTLGDGSGFGRIEYAYSLMAREAGIDMPQTQLYEENGRAHFMTRRFDRPGDVRRLHMQTLCAMAHLDYNTVHVHDYAQLQQTIKALGLGQEAANEAYRRMVFNYAAWNCDDHTKNHSFLMTPDGEWSLSPAYDVAFSYREDSKWVSEHLMAVNGKFLHVSRSEMLDFAETHGIAGAKSIIADVNDAISRWAEFADKAGVPPEDRADVEKYIDVLR